MKNFFRSSADEIRTLFWKVDIAMLGMRDTLAAHGGTLDLMPVALRGERLWMSTAPL